MVTLIGVSYNETASYAGSLSVTLPAGTQAGDVLVFAAGSPSASLAIATGGIGTGTGPFLTIGAAYRVLSDTHDVTGATPSSIAFSTTAGQPLGAVIATYRGAVTSTGRPFDTATTSTGAALNVPALTTSGANSLLAGVVVGEPVSTYTAAAGFTESFDGSALQGLASSWMRQAVAGSTGTMTFTPSPASGRHAAIVWELVADPSYVDPVAGASRTDCLDIDIGEVLHVENPPNWLPPETIREVVQGSTETLSNFGYTITWNCTPASVYDVPVLAATTATDGDRLGSGFTTLTTGINATVTSFQISTTDGAPLWSTTASGYPVWVGGEEMTVTSITGGSSPQTAVVTRGVNGIQIAHPAGTSFDVTPTYLGL